MPTDACRPTVGSMPRITVTSVHVDDQTRALAFYTEVLGFVIKHDLPAGDFRWLTVVDPGDPGGTQLLLEPDQHPAARAYAIRIVCVRRLFGSPISSCSREP